MNRKYFDWALNHSLSFFILWYIASQGLSLPSIIWTLIGKKVMLLETWHLSIDHKEIKKYLNLIYYFNSSNFQFWNVYCGPPIHITKTHIRSCVAHWRIKKSINACMESSPIYVTQFGLFSIFLSVCMFVWQARGRVLSNLWAPASLARPLDKSWRNQLVGYTEVIVVIVLLAVMLCYL